jgi:hypothetical protein
VAPTGFHATLNCETLEARKIPSAAVGERGFWWGARAFQKKSRRGEKNLAGVK